MSKPKPVQDMQARRIILGGYQCRDRVVIECCLLAVLVAASTAKCRPGLAGVSAERDVGQARKAEVVPF